MRAKYKADKTGDRADPCPIPMLTLKNEEEKLFQNTKFSSQLDNLKRNVQPLSQIQPF